ncbi:MAG TPA: RDD family protein [Chthonomonadales bacterium]|nr:RDD family protein [Chthonomonadales bacterium]
MSRSIAVVTPENIVINYPLAGSASRLIAGTVDLAIQVALMILVSQAGRMVLAVRAISADLASLLSAVRIIFTFSVLLVYPTLFEMLWGGQTPGKRLFGLRAIRDGGYPINLTSSLIRNVLRLVDFGIAPLPGGSGLILFGMPGLVSIILSSQNKRIGDYAAGSIVILDSPASRLNLRTAPRLSARAAAMAPTLQGIDRVTPGEYRLLRRFVERRSEMEPMAQAGLAERLVKPLLLRVVAPEPLNYQLEYADLAEAIERRYADERGIL